MSEDNIFDKLRKKDYNPARLRVLTQIAEEFVRPLFPRDNLHIGRFYPCDIYESAGADERPFFYIGKEQCVEIPKFLGGVKKRKNIEFILYLYDDNGIVCSTDSKLEESKPQIKELLKSNGLIEDNGPLRTYMPFD